MKKVFYFILILTLYGCVEEFDLKVDDAKSKIVIEGLVENTSGPHYIRLTESNAGVFSTPSEIYPNLVTLKPISDALVIISDNIGQIDTLKPIKADRDQYIFDESLNATVKYVKDDNGNIIDTIYLNDILNYHIGGFYKTSNLIGVAERTYTLKVVTKEQEIFTATDYMPITAQIDSIGFEKKFLKKMGKKDLYHYFILKILKKTS